MHRVESMRVEDDWTFRNHDNSVIRPCLPVALRAVGVERRLRGGETGDRHPERGAADVVEADAVEELHRLRLAAVLAADAELEVRPGRAAGRDRLLHDRADAGLVDRLE